MMSVVVSLPFALRSLVRSRAAPHLEILAVRAEKSVLVVAVDAAAADAYASGR
jgi:hypothetical protein